MLLLVYFQATLFASCLALPPSRKLPSSNSIPEPEELHIQIAPGGGLADFPEIVDETNLVNTATNNVNAAQPNSMTTIPEATLAEISKWWNPFSNYDQVSEDGPNDNDDDLITRKFPNLANMPLHVLSNLLTMTEAQNANNQQHMTVQQPAVILHEDDEVDLEDEEADTSLADIVFLDLSDPDSTGLGYVEAPPQNSDPAGPHRISNVPMAKRDLIGQEDEPEPKEFIQKSQKTLLKRDDEDSENGEIKIITPPEWELWSEALNETAFDPLFRAIQTASELGLDLERASFQEARISKGAINPNAFLNLVFYPMYDKIMDFAMSSSGESLAKIIYDYKEPVRGMIRVNDGIVQAFINNYTDASLAFSAVADNIAGTARKLSTNSQARSFETWAKDPNNNPQQLVPLITNLSQAIDAIFSAFSTLTTNYGFLGAEYMDVDFGELAAELDDDLVIEKPQGPSAREQASGTVRYDMTSGLDPEGDMFKSRELPRVLPPIQS